MRFILCLLFLGLFVPQAHADVFYPYIQVQCEPDKNIFDVRDISVGETAENGMPVPDIKSIITPGAIFSKFDKIFWTTSGDDMTARSTGTDQGLDIPSCVIGQDKSQIEFKVIRTAIDQRSARGPCAAAGSAEFTVYVNNVALGVYP